MKKEFLLVILLAFPTYSVLANDGNEILLKSRRFIPQNGVTAEAKTKIESISGKVHVIIQLERKPTIEDINQLENKGVRLLSYIPQKAWLASIPSDKVNKIITISNIRSISEIWPNNA